MRDQLLAQATLLDVVTAFQALHTRGTAHEGTCPSCHVDKALKVTPSKNLVKCFKCGQGGVGPIGYLTEMQGMKYVEACLWLAKHYNIELTPEEPYVHPDHLPGRSSTQVQQAQPAHSTDFRDAQLRASGIPDEAQSYTITHIAKDGTTTEEILHRYTAGSIDAKGQPTTGHDMLLHYLDLDGQPIMYKHPVARREVPYIRIRHAFPELHTDKEGAPIRYKSPREGGNHLWIPEYIRRAFTDKTAIDTLVFIEGEKKADALCLAGIPAVGIAGIHNFAYSNEMPSQIERLIRGCGVTRVVFWLDADWSDIGSDVTKHADSRPKTFARAVIKFRSYFVKYQGEGVNLQSYLAHGIDRATKGADDLLLSLTDPQALAADLSASLRSHTGTGTHIQTYCITSEPDTKIYELWHLHSPKAFMHHHRELLKTVPEFRIKGIRYRYDEDAADFVIAQKLLPSEKYWIERKGKDGHPSVEFDYYNITLFLANRGYARYQVDPGIYRLIHTEDNVVTEVDSDAIQRYVLEFTKSIEEIDVVRMLMRGGNMYLGPDKMKNLSFESPSFIQPRRDQQIICFRDTYWVITPTSIKEYKHKELPGHIWKQDIIDFAPTIIPDFLKLDPPTAERGVWVDCKDPDCDIFKYLFLTSDIHWRNSRQTASTFPDEAAGDVWTDTDRKRLDTLMSSMADKIIATGYVLAQYMDPACSKSVVCMDAYETESGKSEGGTGKSIWGTQFEHMMPTKVIDAKSPRLTEDAFLYEGVDERTRAIVFDDCRRTIDFESFLSHITRGITVNAKGIAKRFVGLKRMIFTTNHSIRGEDKSYIRRQYVIGFSDYFNPERTPYKIFGHSLFVEWEHDQWNAWFNYMAHSLQIYMRLGLVTFAPDEDIQRRKRRDMIGETMLEFLETYFYEGSQFLNVRLQLTACLEAFLRQYPDQRKFIARKQLKDKLRVYCQYAGYDYNLPQQGGRMRTGSSNTEYFIITDSTFNLNQYEYKIKTQALDFESEPSF